MSGDSEREPYRSRLYAATTRYGLVRPLQGRYVAGVCAAVGRATGTDPVLWRVILTVLTCFGGVGVLVYLLLWLLVPAEGDTAAPVEALFGQGQSGTSPWVAITLLAVVLLTVVFVPPRALNLVLLGAVTTLGMVLLLQHHQGRAGARPAPPAGGPQAGEAAPPAGTPGTGRPAPSGEALAPGYAAFPPAPDTGRYGPAAAASAAPGPGVTAPVAAPPSGFPPPATPPGAEPARGRHPRSPLLPAAFFLAVLVLGALWLLELSDLVDVPAAGYVAAPLAVVGAALVVGAWTGGARLLIVPGLALSLALPVGHAMDSYRPQNVGTQVTWTPTSVAELQDEYEVSFGEGVLDLRQVDFSGQDAETAVRASFGEVRVLLPPEVDLEAEAQARFGSVGILGVEYGGVRASRTVAETGEPGGGTLRLDLRADMGHVEVTR